MSMPVITHIYYWGIDLKLKCVKKCSRSGENCVYAFLAPVTHEITKHATYLKKKFLSTVHIMILKKSENYAILCSWHHRASQNSS